MATIRNLGIKSQGNNKIYLKGYIKNLEGGYNYCIVFHEPGGGAQQNVGNSAHSYTYISVSGSGYASDYDFATRGLYLPDKGEGMYTVKCLMVGNSCEDVHCIEDVAYITVKGAGCQTGCEASCQSGCEGSCQSGCEGSCQSGCEGSCQSGCEGSCQDACEASCQWSCELACQTGCEGSCQTGCEGSCQTGCEGGCQWSCELDCQTGCEGACQSECEGKCQSGCEVSCQATCEADGCPDKCYDKDLWSEVCEDGECVKDRRIERNSPDCGACIDGTISADGKKICENGEWIPYDPGNGNGNGNGTTSKYLTPEQARDRLERGLPCYIKCTLPVLDMLPGITYTYGSWVPPLCAITKTP